jgi:hypothetical protein
MVRNMDTTRPNPPHAARTGGLGRPKGRLERDKLDCQLRATLPAARPVRHGAPRDGPARAIRGAITSAGRLALSGTLDAEDPLVTDQRQRSP